MTANHLGGKFKQNRQDHADAQYPQGFIGLIGNHAVVHVHHIQGADERKEVDDDGGQNDLVVVAAETPNDFPKPCFGQMVFRQLRAHIGRHFGFDKPAVAQIQAGELLVAEFLFQTVNLADMVCALLAGAFDLGDDRCLFVVQDNHDRHGERGDVFQIAFG